MIKDERFCIDFHEFSFLVEACIPPRPIARTMFWHEVIDKYYGLLTGSERVQLYEWISKNKVFQDGLDKGNEDCLIFDARYDPDNQFLVTAEYKGKSEQKECFFLNGRYYIRRNTSIMDCFIIDIKKI